MSKTATQQVKTEQVTVDNITVTTVVAVPTATFTSKPCEQKGNVPQRVVQGSPLASFMSIAFRSDK
jgi:hypothetical protein